MNGVNAWTDLTTEHHARERRSLPKLFTLVTGTMLVIAFAKQMVKTDLGLGDWIGFPIGMAAASSPTLMLYLIRAMYGVSKAPTEDKP